MAYTSGRTVKSSRKAKPTTVASATAAARKLVKRHLPEPLASMVTIGSSRTADPKTLVALVRTVVTYPASTGEAAAPLVAAIADLPGYEGMLRSGYGVTFIRSV